MSAPSRNVELKARDEDPSRTLRLALALGAQDRGELVQRDTYFTATEGRLKLREEAHAHARAHLIAYERADRPDQRTSEYRLVPVEDPAGMRAALDAALGITVVVEKCRRLLLWQGVRIHLDAVDDLGTFVELEAVAAPQSDLTREHALVTELRAALEIDADAIEAGSYVDLLVARLAMRAEAR